MRLLFAIDGKDYDDCQRVFVRNSARSIIIKNQRVAMVHSLKYDYYKFPGGGIEKGEDVIDALIRETKEESGLNIAKDSIIEYGYVHIIHKSDSDERECFIQDNYYYLCQTDDEIFSQDLDDYENEEGFTLEYVDPDTAIMKDMDVKGSPYNPAMFIREAGVLKLLKEDGLV